MFKPLYFLKVSSIEQYILSGIFLVHYFHRVVVDVLNKPKGSSTLQMVVIALIFTVTNSYLQAEGLSQYDKPRNHWLRLPFLVGLLLWAMGMWLNIQCDSILHQLKQTGKYRIPFGCLFEYVTCGNYLAEIIEWAGWALDAGTCTTWAFVGWSMVNLVPRAHMQHEWYLKNFEYYKKLNRYKIIPYLY